MHKNEAAALNTLGRNTLIPLPAVYFTVDANDDIPMDFIVEEYVSGTDCFTAFGKLFKSKEKNNNLPITLLKPWLIGTV